MYIIYIYMPSWVKQTGLCTLYDYEQGRQISSMCSTVQVHTAYAQVYIHVCSIV